MKIIRLIEALAADFADLLFERDDREAGPEAAPLSDREAQRTYERAGLGFFA